MNKRVQPRATSHTITPLIGTVSFNIYCNFTNYGSALQTWALHQAITKLGYPPVLVDYCPDILADKDILNPFGNMLDQDEESKRMVELSMPAIRENYRKIDSFYRQRFTRTAKKYTSHNFSDITSDENIHAFICGSDTIFCPDEFGIDDGYYANYDCMRGHSAAYAASFGDPTLTEDTYHLINARIPNFLALGIRENQMIPYLREHTKIPVQKVIDPTLLLSADEYIPVTAQTHEDDKYLLMYSSRYSPEMEACAEEIARANGWKIVDISLRAVNAERGHKMAYAAGVEEFLSLVKHAEYVVTNSFHGLIFSVQFRRPFSVFVREQSSSKINEVLSLFGLGLHSRNVDYDAVHRNIESVRAEAMSFLKMELDMLRDMANVH